MLIVIVTVIFIVTGTVRVTVMIIVRFTVTITAIVIVIIKNPGSYWSYPGSRYYYYCHKAL